MKRNGWLAVALAAVCVLAEVAVAQDEGRLAGSPLTSRSRMEFVWVPAGKFQMGSPEGEEGSDSDEVQHEVKISKGFWMGKYEVTQKEWEDVMSENPSDFKGCDRCPVENVSWDDIQVFIRKLNERDIQLNEEESSCETKYRLPTEAEWEYAARARVEGAAPDGDLGNIAWYIGNSDTTTHKVGGLPANAWGLHDMLGNVWEWTEDWYGAYPEGPSTDPEGPSTGTYRVSRGGAWNYGAERVRYAYRSYDSPGDRGYSLGFRLVRTECRIPD